MQKNHDGTLIQCQGLKRLYRLKGETIHALDGVDFTVAPGEFLAIAGPSGSGKSTLLNLLGALDTPTQGTVELAGQNLGKLSNTEKSKLRCNEIGFIFQAYNLIPVLTVRENVEYVMLLQGVPAQERHRRAAAILEEVGLKGFEDRRPADLSGGQQQRVAVARAIVAEPAIVLADEPTANLDTTTAEGLLDTMEELNREKGVTFLFSTHDTKVMARARRLVKLRDGRIESDEKKTALA